MSNENVQNTFKMPAFAIDTIVTDGKEIPGIKRMFDIALALNDSIMLWGAPGVGKSQSVQQWNQEKVEEYNQRIANGENVKPWDPHVYDIRLALCEPVDIVGVPTIVDDGHGNKITVWATADRWPKDDGKYSGHTVIIDEINQGSSACMNASFQIIQDHAINNYKFPENTIIIAAGNQSAYNSTVTEFSIPLSNRFSHFNIKSDFEGWMNYRMNNGGNLDVMTFLKTQDPGLLFDTKTLEDRIGDSLDNVMFTDIVITPRSWEVVEKLLSLPEGTKENGGFTMAEKRAYATGRLGGGITSKLFKFIENKTKYQDWHEILVDGKDFRDENSEQFWAVQMACMSAITNCNDDTKCRGYVLNFIKATRNLKSAAYKSINITGLIRCKRLKGALAVFNPMKDATDFLTQIAAAIRS